MLMVCTVAYVGCLLTMVGATVALTCVQSYAPGLSLMSTQQLPLDVPVVSHRKLPPPAGSSVLSSGCFRVEPAEQLSVSFGNNLKDDIPVNESESDQDVKGHPIEISGKPHDRNCLASSPRPRWQERSQRKLKRRQRAPAHSENQHLKAPSFLTLSLLQDTLLQFVSAVSERLTTTYPETSHQCSCGYCPGTVDPHCQNVTVLSPCDRLSNDELNCGNNDGSRCCCSLKGSGTLSPWQLEQLRIPPRLNEVTYGFRTTSMVTWQI